ncbi:MAG: 9-O-acetylesterase [Gammaproteobacteria bacterium]|nr:MAG: 9-O-acetylesterase [Gammaproteobacteria bacterium]
MRLPRLWSDGLVLQRDAVAAVGGWAPPGAVVEVHWRGERHTGSTDLHGRWRIALPTGAAGGPFTLTVADGRDRIEIRDVLVGDVWLASGQSNMEMTVARVLPRFPGLLDDADQPAIRQFDVPDRYAFRAPETDLAGGAWVRAGADTVPDFSALAWFFARALRARHDVPIGLINASLGGSPVEAWMAAETLEDFPELLERARRWADPREIEAVEKADQARIAAWQRRLDEADPGLAGGRPRWAEPGLDDAGWTPVAVPDRWPDRRDAWRAPGAVWYRTELRLPRELAGQAGVLELGRLADADRAWVNGVEVGQTGYEWPPRRYPIPAGVLRAGANSIVVRLVIQREQGGFVPGKALALHAAGRRFELAGLWRMRRGADAEPLDPPTFIRWQPVGLYNGMIAPLVGFPIKGVIWYQGESNVGRAEQYRTLFARLIGDWRARWGQGDFPFLFVQLAAFLAPNPEPADSAWARLREAQARVAAAVPNTAMAVAIDLGEWNDIHPLDKRTLGERLAAAAEVLAYGGRGVHQGPVFRRLERDGPRLRVYFDHVGGGLVAVGGDAVREFAVAGADRRFVRAQARIEGDHVVVWSDAVPRPVAVRYAWADNPERANLYNAEGFPAVPFRSDDW